MNAEIKKRRRKYERASTLVLLDVDAIGNQYKSGRAVVVDISVGGVAFESIAEFSLGVEVILRYIMPGENVYVLAGVVKRVEDKDGVFVYGVEFKYMNYWGRRKLKKLIRNIGKK